MSPTTGQAGGDKTDLDGEVAFWDARLRSPLCSDEDREAFAQWRDADPARAAAFAAFQGYLEMLHGAYRSAPELRAFRDEALNTIGAGRRRKLAVGAAAAAVVLMSISALGLLQLRRQQAAPTAVAAAEAPSNYQTAVGERSTILLSDGSRATLDTRSRMEVQFGATERSVRILSGQALFDVAKESSRPFVVTASGQRVVAVGTQFAVRMDPDRVSVTLVEGRVTVEHSAVTERSGTQARHDLVAGQQLVALNDASAVEVQWTNVAGATSWSEGRVLFEGKPLADVVTEINRYSPTRIVVRDAAVGKMQISGMFRTDQPLDFVRALPDYFPIQLEATADQLLLSTRG